MTALSEHLKPC